MRNFPPFSTLCGIMKSPTQYCVSVCGVYVTKGRCPLEHSPSAAALVNEDETDENLRVPVTTRLCNMMLYSGGSHSCHSLTVQPLPRPPLPAHPHPPPYRRDQFSHPHCWKCRCVYVSCVRVCACAPWTSIRVFVQPLVFQPDYIIPAWLP